MVIGIPPFDRPSIQNLGEGRERLEVTWNGEQRNALRSWWDYLSSKNSCRRSGLFYFAMSTSFLFLNATRTDRDCLTLGQIVVCWDEGSKFAAELEVSSIYFQVGRS